MMLRDLFQWLGYIPHAGQESFHQSDARFKVLVAGARFGKSLAAARDNLPDVLCGQSSGWMVGPTFALTGPELDYLFADLQTLGARTVSTARLPGMQLSWSADVEGHTAFMPRTLLGREIDWLILCEAAHIPREAFERFLRARLTTRTGRLTVATSPRGRNWIHGLFEQGTTGAPDWQSFRHATWENPAVPASEVESARRSLPAETFDEQYGGQFVTSAGAVYREFQRALHVADLCAPPGSLIFKSIDIGYTSPFACLWAALDHDNRLLILREHYRDHTAIPEHAEAIRAVDAEYAQAGCTIGPAWADPAAAGERRILADCGVRTQTAEKHVSGGIETVRSRLLPMPDGRPALLIDRGCVNLVRELEGYVWQESSRGERVPVKRDDHALDALRYLCVALARKVDWKGKGTYW